MIRISAVRFRVRRVTTEYAFVDVPLSVLSEREGKPDFSSLPAAAVEMAKSAKIEWVPEGEPDVHPHPIQGPVRPSDPA